MRGSRAILASLVAAVLLVSVNAGLRALHLTVAACDVAPAASACGQGHDAVPAAPAHGEQDCATCELLLTLATLAAPHSPWSS